MIPVQRIKERKGLSKLQPLFFDPPVCVCVDPIKGHFHRHLHLIVGIDMSNQCRMPGCASHQ